jgi:hypothetical protein
MFNLFARKKLNKLEAVFFICSLPTILFIVGKILPNYQMMRM